MFVEKSFDFQVLTTKMKTQGLTWYRLSARNLTALYCDVAFFIVI